jgi:L-fuculose-phosphate aldolase
MAGPVDIAPLLSYIQPTMPSPFTIRSEIVEVGRRLHQSGMIAGTDGNISVRLDDNRIMITPSGVSKGHMKAEDMVIVDVSGRHLQGKGRGSSEMAMHLFVYRNRPEIRACVHAHPIHATAFAVAGLALAEDVLPEVVVFVGGIPLTDYAPPGTDAVPKSLEPFIEKQNAFLLRNHGLLTIGRTLDEAFFRHETVEHYARIVSVARQLGNIHKIPSEDFRRLESMRAKLDSAWEKKD